MDPKSVGLALKKLRVERRLSLKDVASATGLSVSFLSMVERGERNLSLDNLKRLASFFGVSVVEFFRNTSHDNPLLVRKHQARKFTVPDEGIVLELLVPDLNRVMEPVLHTVKPGHGCENPFRHEGEEFVYVISGTLDVIIGETTYKLCAGDCLYFPSGTPHRWVNNGEEVSVSLWVSSPPSF